MAEKNVKKITKKSVSKKLNILVVDDESDVLDTAKIVLEKQGYSVDTAKNGAKALDGIKKAKYDLILIDIMMPTLSGYDLLRLLREKLNGGTKMAYITIVPKDDVDLTGIDGFIQKPYSTDTLIKKVKVLLK